MNKTPTLDTNSYEKSGGDFADFFKVPSDAEVGDKIPATIKSAHRTFGQGSTTFDIEIDGSLYSFGHANKTNLAALVSQFGKDTDGWIGKKIVLVVTTANNPSTGQETNTFRVVTPKSKK